MQSSTVFVLINGSPTQQIQSSRGHEQSNPMSPFF